MGKERESTNKDTGRDKKWRGSGRDSVLYITDH